MRRRSLRTSSFVKSLYTFFQFPVSTSLLHDCILDSASLSPASSSASLRPSFSMNHHESLWMKLSILSPKQSRRKSFFRRNGDLRYFSISLLFCSRIHLSRVWRLSAPFWVDALKVSCVNNERTLPRILSWDTLVLSTRGWILSTIAVSEISWISFGIVLELAFSGLRSSAQRLSSYCP